MEQTLWDADDRDAARRDLKAARYAIRLTSSFYQRARENHMLDGGQASLIHSCRERWYEDLREFIRSIIYIAEIETRLDLSSFLQEADSLGEVPESRQLDRAKAYLAECREVVDILFSEYLEARSRGGSEETSAAWEEWGVSLKRWGNALRNREEARDRVFAQRKDGFDLATSSKQESGTSISPSELMRKNLEWARQHVHSQDQHAETSRPTNGDPLPLGRREDSILHTSVSERQYRLILQGLITVITIPGHREARKLRKGLYLGLTCKRDVHYARIARVTGYPSVDGLIKGEPIASLDPDSPPRQVEDQCNQQYVSYKMNHLSEEVRGIFAIEFERPRNTRNHPR